MSALDAFDIATPAKIQWPVDKGASSSSPYSHPLKLI